MYQEKTLCRDPSCSFQKMHLLIESRPLMRNVPRSHPLRCWSWASCLCGKYWDDDRQSNKVPTEGPSFPCQTCNHQYRLGDTMNIWPSPDRTLRGVRHNPLQLKCSKSWMLALVRKRIRTSDLRTQHRVRVATIPQCLFARRHRQRDFKI
jgi:hypothetical protein